MLFALQGSARKCNPDMRPVTRFRAAYGVIRTGECNNRMRSGSERRILFAPDIYEKAVPE